MGFIISKFRRKKTTSEQLDTIDQKIKNIEKFQKETEQQFRRVIGKLIVGSIVIYIVALIGYYYYYSPETFRQNILKFVPLLVFPFIIFFSRRLLSWYYKRKLSKNESTLVTLKAGKKKILEEVMDKETYKKAKEILEKYAPDQLSKDAAKQEISPMKAIMMPTATPARKATPARSETLPRQRLMTATPSVRKLMPNGDPSEGAFQAVPVTPSLAQPRLSLTRPILQRERGAFDKLIDMIIGDGPGNRYALICRMCSSHNGMALKHEFEYIAFRCAYCLQWNPARKQKPHAPNLMFESGSQDDSDANNSEAETNEPMESTNLSEANSDLPKVQNDDSTEMSENDIRSELIKEENCSDMEQDESPHVEDDLNRENTGKGEDPNVPVSSENVDLSDLRHALDELEKDLSSSDSTSDITEQSSNSKKSKEENVQEES